MRRVSLHPPPLLTKCNGGCLVVGESFAGHYIPAVSARILAGNSNPGATIIRLRGIAIGNGWIDPYLQYPDYVPFALENQLIDSSTAKSLNTTARHCQSLINDKLYTLANIECSSIMARVLSEAGNINLYNIKLPCVGQLCYNFTAQTDYMTSSALRQALHIRSESPAWSTCDDTVNRDFTVKDRISSFRQDIALNLEAKVQVTIYNGVEYSCPCGLTILWRIHCLSFCWCFFGWWCRCVSYRASLLAPLVSANRNWT